MKIPFKKLCSVLLATAALLVAVPFTAQSGAIHVDGQAETWNQMYRTGNADDYNLSGTSLRLDTTNSSDKSWTAVSGLC